MKKITLLLFVACLPFLGCTQKSTDDTQKLASLCQIWGFLKYYHPTIAKGNFDWDQQLFDLIPQIKLAEGKEEISAVYLRWIETLGEVEECITCNEENDKEYFGKNFDLSWIDNQDLYTAELSKKLRHIENNRFQGDNHYVTIQPGVGNVIIKNDDAYPEQSDPNENYRLLSLFRYWNIVEYFFPYKYQADEDWDAVLLEMIPKFKNEEDLTKYHLAMLELVAKIDDGHASFTSNQTMKYFGLKYVPFISRILDGKSVITGFFNENLAANDDLRIGDAIISIDGKKVIDIYKEREKYFCGSNEAFKKTISFSGIFNDSIDKAQITFERNGKVEKKEIRRYDFNQFAFTGFSKGEESRTISPGVAYVNMGMLEESELPAMMDSLLNFKTIIFDIRYRPHNIIFPLAKFLKHDETPFSKTLAPDIDYPGKFFWKNEPTCGDPNPDYFKGQIVLLTNYYTGSQSEYTTMALQSAKNTIVIGETTAGANGNISPFSFVGGFKTRISGIGVFYPDGRETQRVGIVPDIPVTPTIKGMAEGRDEILERAIEFADSGK